jgi:hypothetical protein
MLEFVVVAEAEADARLVCDSKNFWLKSESDCSLC